MGREYTSCFLSISERAADAEIAVALLCLRSGNKKKALEACNKIEYAELDRKSTGTLADIYSKLGCTDKAARLMRKLGF